MKEMLHAMRITTPILLRFIIVLLIIIFTSALPARAGSEEEVGFISDQPGQMLITIGGEPIAIYVYQDQEIARPYFFSVRVPGGAQVTRNYPPIEGQDISDHATYHPGLWMSFGDISGSDYWRLKAPVEHVRFVGTPQGGPGKGTFVVLNRYLAQDDNTKVVCEERCRYTVLVRPAGYMLLWDTTFSSDHEFYFGDQEEMGIGFRVATPLRVEHHSDKYPHAVSGTGTILDAKGRKNGDEVWGNASAWCDYSGTLAGQHIGILLMCHPGNFRPSWFHARDYGLLEANPFGRKAFEKGDKSKIVVKPGESLRLRYGLLLHSGPQGSTTDLPAAYDDYLRVARE